MTKVQPLGGPHEALNHLMDEIGATAEGTPDAGPRVAANFLGMGRGTLYKALDADDGGAELSFVRVAMLTSRFKAKAAALHLARLLGCELVAFRPGRFGGTAISALAHMVKETSEAISAVADWAQDPQKATTAMLRKVLTEIDQAIEALIEMRQRVMSRLEDEEGGQ